MSELSKGERAAVHVLELETLRRLEAIEYSELGHFATGIDWVRVWATYPTLSQGEKVLVRAAAEFAGITSDHPARLTLSELRQWADVDCLSRVGEAIIIAATGRLAVSA